MPIAALPTDALSLVLAQLGLVRNIQGVKRVCRAFRDAAGPAEKAHRRVCFEDTARVMCVAAARRRAEAERRELAPRRRRRLGRARRRQPGDVAGAVGRHPRVLRSHSEQQPLGEKNW